MLLSDQAQALPKIVHGKGDVLIHRSVRLRWEQDPKYRPQDVVEFLAKRNDVWPRKVS